MKSCDDVIRELAAPTDDRDPVALEAHLASCPSCARWADRSAGFDRLWVATRPEEPSEAAWDSVWTTVLHGLETPLEAPTPLRLVPSALSPWPRRGRVVFGLAQAAALLLAAGLLWQQPPTPSPAPSLSSSSSLVAVASPARSEVVEVDIEAGQIVMIRFEAGDATPVKLALERTSGLPDACDDQIVMLGALESSALGGANW